MKNKSEINDKNYSSPGSDEAIEQGCLCPVLDNAHGLGYMRFSTGNRLFVISSACPLHFNEVKDQLEDLRNHSL